MAKNHVWTVDDLRKLGFDETGKRISKAESAKPVPKKAEGQVFLNIPQNCIFIPGNVPSSKNSKQAYVREVGGKMIPGITDSKLTKEYRKNSKKHWEGFREYFLQQLEGKSKPYRVEFFFTRSKANRSDFHNLVQVILDLMTEYRWIDDDNMNEVLPYPPMEGPAYMVDSLMPGVYIKVL